MSSIPSEKSVPTDKSPEKSESALDSKARNRQGQEAATELNAGSLNKRIQEGSSQEKSDRNQSLNEQIEKTGKAKMGPITKHFGMSMEITSTSKSGKVNELVKGRSSEEVADAVQQMKQQADSDMLMGAGGKMVRSDNTSDARTAQQNTYDQWGVGGPPAETQQVPKDNNPTSANSNAGDLVKNSDNNIALGTEPDMGKNADLFKKLSNNEVQAAGDIGIPIKSLYTDEQKAFLEKTMNSAEKEIAEAMVTTIEKEGGKVIRNELGHYKILGTVLAAGMLLAGSQPAHAEGNENHTRNNSDANLDKIESGARTAFDVASLFPPAATACMVAAVGEALGEISIPMMSMKQTRESIAAEQSLQRMQCLGALLDPSKAPWPMDASGHRVPFNVVQANAVTAAMDLYNSAEQKAVEQDGPNSNTRIILEIQKQTLVKKLRGL